MHNNGVQLPVLLYSQAYGLGSTLNGTKVHLYMVLVRLGGVSVEGLVDSDCGCTLVWGNVVLSEKMDWNLPRDVSGMQGEIWIYPTAGVELGVQEQRGQLHIRVLKDLLRLMILGRDWLGFPALIQS